jgi:glycosyltransferase involved in cell wall biosynthesis
MPWRISLPEGLEIRFNQDARIVGEHTYFHRRCLALRKWVLGVVQQEQPAFVLMAGHADFTRLLLIGALRRRRIPVVHLSDANVFGLRRGGAVKAALRAIYHGAVLGRFDGYMTMGTCGRAYYDLLGDRSRPTFISPYEPDYAAIEARDHESEAALASRLGLPPGRRRFLYSGRLVGWKRVDLLVRAFVAVADRLPEWDLVVAGGGPDMDALRNLVPGHLGSRVAFTGFLQMDDVRRCCHLSDVLVHPSNWEPWALVINEAAAAGMAIVATHVTGAAVELVRHGKNGFLVRPDNLEDLERALVLVADPERLASMKAASRDLLLDWRRSADPVQGVVDAARHFARQHAGGA